jgi:hypothetical protein
MCVAFQFNLRPIYPRFSQGVPSPWLPVFQLEWIEDGASRHFINFFHGDTSGRLNYVLQIVIVKIFGHQTGFASVFVDICFSPCKERGVLSPSWPCREPPPAGSARQY